MPAVFLNPMDWYWAVAGNSNIYASGRNIYVPPADPGFVAWNAMNSIGAPIASEAEIWPYVGVPPRSLPEWLFDGTTFVQPTPTTYTKTQLAAYSANARYNHASNGVIVTSIGGAVPFLTDPVSRNTVNSAYDYMTQKGTGTTVQWKLSNGTFITMNTTQMTALMNAMSTFVQSCFAAESTTDASINSGGTTTLAQIDAAYAAISNTFP